MKKKKGDLLEARSDGCRIHHRYTGFELAFWIRLLFLMVMNAALALVIKGKLMLFREL